jgi:hypothetical protein
VASHTAAPGVLTCAMTVTLPWARTVRGVHSDSVRSGGRFEVGMSRTCGRSAWVDGGELAVDWWAAAVPREGTAATSAGSRNASTKQKCLPLIAAPNLGSRRAVGAP